MVKSGRKISARSHASTDISIRALRVFVAVQEAGSLAAAARNMGISKSSISQHISNLEQSIGAVLVDRSTRPVSLTPAGRVFKGHALNVLNAVSDARADLMQMDVSEFAELHIGMIDDLDATLTPEVVEHLSKMYPHSVFTASSGLSDTLTQMIVSRDADIVLTAAPPVDNDIFTVLPILTEPFILACAHGLLSGSGEIRPRLGQFPFIRYSAGIPIGRKIETHLSRTRVDYARSFAFDTSRSVFAMTIKAGGWTITTPLCVLESQRFRTALDFHKLPFPELTRTISLVARPNELGSLPEQLGQLCRSLLRRRLAEAAHQITPWMQESIQVFAD